MSTTTWPIEPVERLIRGRLGTYNKQKNPTGYCASNAARLLGVHHTTWTRWVERGELTDGQADQAATALGAAAEALWPDWYTGVHLTAEDEAWVAAWVAGEAVAS